LSLLLGVPSEPSQLPGALIQAAVGYAEAGLPVFPIRWPINGQCSCNRPQCSSPAKHPLTEHGFEDATTDPEQIKLWWRQWPQAGIGLPTGTATGFLVVDVDPRNGGTASFDEVVTDFGPFPETAVQRSGGGGQHLFFRYAGGAVPKNLATGIDLKGDGGYVVVAPSWHLSGNQYRWESTDGIQRLSKAAYAPQWLTDFIAAKKSPKPARNPESVGSGERNTVLCSFAGKLRRSGLSSQLLELALVEENANRCRPPLPEAEVRSIARSVFKISD
jgi:hypothetical protein